MNVWMKRTAGVALISAGLVAGAGTAAMADPFIDSGSNDFSTNTQGASGDVDFGKAEFTFKDDFSGRFGSGDVTQTVEGAHNNATGNTIKFKIKDSFKKK